MAKTVALTDFLQTLDHPRRDVIDAVRGVLAAQGLQERVKWNSPSFYLGNFDFSAFHLRNTDCAHLIIVYPPGSADLQDFGLLEGKHVDRREAKFYSLADFEAKKPALESVVQDWLRRVMEGV